MIESFKQHMARADSVLMPLFFTHWLERLLFLSVSIVWPLKLMVNGLLSAPQAGLFYSILFAVFRASPVFYAYLAKNIAREKLFLCGAVIESCAFLGMIFTRDPSSIMLLAVLAGIGGGATSSMLLSLLEEVDKKRANPNVKKDNHHVFNIHLMLINLAAAIAPMLAMLSYSQYFASIITLFTIFIFTALFTYRRTSHLHLTPEKTENQDRAIDRKFLSEWLAAFSAWAGCSVVYAILPSLDSHFLASEGVNFWLSFDAIIVTSLFFIMRKYNLLSDNTPTNALKGLAAIILALLIFHSGTTHFALLLVSISLLSFGGYVAFGQIYGLAMETTYSQRKTFYLCLLSLCGAAGEGGVQALFWLTGSTKQTLFIVLVLVIAGMCPMLFRTLRSNNTPVD